MKHLKKTFIAAALLLLAARPSFAQQWMGADDYTEGINRYGDVGVGAGVDYQSYTSAFEVNQNDDTHWSAFLFNGGGTGQGLRIKGAYWSYATPLLQIEANSPVSNYNQDNIRFQVQANGCVGIGTTFPYNPNSYLLAVNGMIGAKAVKIENTSELPE